MLLLSEHSWKGGGGLGESVPYGSGGEGRMRPTRFGTGSVEKASSLGLTQDASVVSPPLLAAERPLAALALGKNPSETNSSGDDNDEDDDDEEEEEEEEDE